MRPQDRTRAILGSHVETSLRMVLVVLADAMTEERETCWLKVETIAERSGLCERQARELLNDAEARGLIRRWDGDHKSRDIAIVWEALAVASPTSSSRGGARKAAKTAAVPADTSSQPAKTAPQTTGKDFHPDRQSLPPQPAKTAAVTGKDCPRSGKEAGTEAGTEAGSARAVAGQPPPPNGQATASLDLSCLGISPRDAQWIVPYCDSIEELQAFSEEEISRWRGLGPPGARRIAKALERKGRHLRPPGVAPPGPAVVPASAPAAPFDWDNPRTWHPTFDGSDPSTWTPEAIASAPRDRQRFRDRWLTEQTRGVAHG